MIFMLVLQHCVKVHIWAVTYQIVGLGDMVPFNSADCGRAGRIPSKIIVLVDHLLCGWNWRNTSICCFFWPPWCIFDQIWCAFLVGTIILACEPPIAGSGRHKILPGSGLIFFLALCLTVIRRRDGRGCQIFKWSWLSTIIHSKA